jgi:hypothetical protein
LAKYEVIIDIKSLEKRRGRFFSCFKFYLSPEEGVLFFSVNSFPVGVLSLAPEEGVLFFSVNSFPVGVLSLDPFGKKSRVP